MSIFNRVLLGKNIRLLTSQKGIKVGDIEDFANVSKGYFSRLANEDNKNSSTLMDTICKVAEKLDVSVNTLISTDLGALTPNEILLSKFFDKLGRDTMENILSWEMETKNQLEDDSVQRIHPLFQAYSPSTYDTTYYYHSEFDSKIKINGDAFKVSLGQKRLYLVKICNTQKGTSGFELYFVSDNGLDYHVEAICNIYSESGLFDIVSDLYNIASCASRNLKLSDSVRSTISNYVNGDTIADAPF